MKLASSVLCCIASALLLGGLSSAAMAVGKSGFSGARQLARDGEAEARLIEIYKLIGKSDRVQALSRAQALVRDHPNFQLAQLVYGDLLAAQVRPVREMGDIEGVTRVSAAHMLAELREESQLRMRALRERPPSGTIPAQFLRLAPRNRHAIAIDTSRARLYLFENSSDGLKLLADYYISVGKSGTEKSAEGDQRTPLGVYFVTSSLDPKSLTNFYGAGALPINYPNPYDSRRGKTGRGIWLHGTPPTQFSRPPKATDGCVVLANPDLQRIISTVEVRTTPVIIARDLNWIAPQAAYPDSRRFADVLQAWRNAKVSGDIARLLSFYTSDVAGSAKTLAEWAMRLKSEVDKARGHDLELKDLSYLRWTDTADTMVVTFGEVLSGMRTGAVKRQYWVREGPAWKIFFEGVIG